MSEPLLEATNLSKSFAGVRALDDYALRLAPLTIHGVIGPNGAGKTTLFNLLTGFIKPTAGMIRSETAELLTLIRRLRDELKITIVMVAHDIPLVMNLCDRIQVLNYGRLIAEGDPATVRNNPEVIVAYLGSVSSQ